MKIEELGLSVRPYNVLKRVGIDTVEQLQKLSDDDLMRFRSMGRHSLAEIREKVAYVKTMTNADRIRVMSNDELAEFIMLSPEMEFDVCECCEVFRGHGAYTPCGTEDGWCTAELRCGAFKKWLQQPAEEVPNAEM